MAYEGYDPDYFEKKAILSVATTGGFQGKEANPNHAEQPEEIAKDVAACEEAGASIVHIHARDEDGNPTKDLDRFQEIRDLIDEHCEDIVVNFTTGGVGFSREERIRPIVETDPRPDIGTIDLGPMSFGQNTETSHPREEHEEYAETMREHGVKPELEIFHPGQLTELNNLLEKDLLESPPWCTIIFGMQTGTIPHPQNVTNFVENLPDGAEWSLLAIGKHQLPLTTMGLVMGGHVRVGMEDNIYYAPGELTESNAQLVRRAARIADELQRPLATPDEAREILDL